MPFIHKPGKRPWFGVIALLFAMTALALSILPVWMDSLGELQKPTMSQKFADTANKTRQALVSRWRGEGSVVGSRRLSLEEVSEVSAVALSFAGVVLGIIAYVSREDLRIGATAAVIGVTAIAWHHLFSALALGVMLIVMGLVVKSLSQAEAQ